MSVCVCVCVRVCVCVCVCDLLCNFTLLNDDIIGVREVPGHHFTLCTWCVISSVGTDGKPPVHMGCSENTQQRDKERVIEREGGGGEYVSERGTCEGSTVTLLRLPVSVFINEYV